MEKVEIDGRHFDGAVHLVLGTVCEPRQKARAATSRLFDLDIRQP